MKFLSILTLVFLFTGCSNNEITDNYQTPRIEHSLVIVECMLYIPESNSYVSRLVVMPRNAVTQSAIRYGL